MEKWKTEQHPWPNVKEAGGSGCMLVVVLGSAVLCRD
jgi:hypothetical protein